VTPAWRYARLLGVQLRTSTLTLFQYRLDFFLEGAMEVVWALTSLVPLVVAFGGRPTVAGWTFDEALLVVGWFTFLQGILKGAIHPSLQSVVEHIRKGTLDFILLKPADAQFLVSTARFQPWRGTNVLTALAIFTVAFARMDAVPSPRGLLLAGLLLVGSTLLLYSLWILTVCAAFRVVKVDNLTFLFESVFDAARWPSTVFRGALAFVFTFLIPLALMTTYPSLALLGRMSWRTVGVSLLGSVAFAWLARRAWLASIGRYTSASS
jgi:ABC-2 type transport system permease protein